MSTDAEPLRNFVSWGKLVLWNINGRRLASSMHSVDREIPG
jgi:hypothetical protein